MTSGWTRLKKLNKNNIEDIQSWYWFWSRTHSEEINCGGFSCGSRLDLAQHRGILHNVRLLKIRSCSRRWRSSKKENLTLLFKTKSPWAANLGFWVKKKIQISVEMRMWLLWIFDATSLVFWLLVRLNPRWKMICHLKELVCKDGLSWLGSNTSWDIRQLSPERILVGG